MPGFARISALLIAVLFLSLAAACGTADEDATSTPSGSGGAPTATSAEEQPPLDGTAWLLQAMNADVAAGYPGLETNRMEAAFGSYAVTQP